MIIANASPDPSYLGEWIIALAFITNLAVSIAALVNSRRAQKREVTFVGDAVSKTEFERHVQVNREAHQQLHNAIAQRAETSRTEVKHDMELLHEKINKVDRDVATSTQVSKLNTEHLLRAESKLETLRRELLDEIKARLPNRIR